jgi:hypothetical protein
MSDQFNPDRWITSMFNALTDFITSEIDGYVVENANGNPVGLQAFEISMDFPEASDLPQSSEFSKTIIHFAIDNIDNRRLGLGLQAVNAQETSSEITYQEGRQHLVNFDIGVWASDKSGGPSSRLQAYEMLDAILATDSARVKCHASTGGIEIRQFNAGRFVTETANDLRVFRIVGAELDVRVFSRDWQEPAFFIDKEPDQRPSVTIGGLPIS